jgi:hypothetical protein
LIRRRNQRIAALFLEIFGAPGRHRRALDFAVADGIDVKSRINAEPHPLDVALQIQAGLLQLDLNCPMANAIEVADADPLAFQLS